MRIFLGLGSNLGDRDLNIAGAVNLIGQKCNIKKLSGIYETRPMYRRNQPWFCNAVLEARTGLSAGELLRFVLGIENRLGRKRISRKRERYGPRTIDIDILFCGDRIIEGKNLKVPHPLLHERPFALVPLVEINPGLVHPSSGLTVKELLEKCDPDGRLRTDVRKLPGNYEEMVGYLFGLRRFTNAYSLGTVKEALRRLGNPHKRLKGSVHVAGTNGKGSTAVMVAAILRASGYKTGIYTSPHLIDFRERIAVNDRLISKEDAWRLFKKIKSVNLDLTFFEFITAMAFEYFREQDVDFAVIEAGLGGKLDATNLIMPLVSVITNVALEHENTLGNTLEQIARQKAGIIKRKTPVVTGCRGKPLEIVSSAAQNAKSALFNARRVKKFSIREGSAVFPAHGREIRLRMKGRFQLLNAALAAKTAEVLTKECGIKLKNNSIKTGLENAFIAGRCEVRHADGKTIIIDGAHNPAAVTALLDSITCFEFGRLISVVSIMKDKNFKSMLESIEKISHRLVLTKASSYRALEPGELAQALNYHSVEKLRMEKDPMKALDLAKAMSSTGDLILVTGSLYLAGNIKAGLSDPKGRGSPVEKTGAQCAACFASSGGKIEYPREMPETHGNAACGIKP